MKRLIIVGSPRSNGRSAHLAEMLFEACIDECPEDEQFLVPVSEVDVGPCIGCNACRELTELAFVDDDGNETTELRPRCVFDDDMQALYDLVDDADEITVVSPVYFSGAPAPMKCILDRLQPYFWANTRTREKRPLVLHAVGEGGDPHGYGALVSEVKSAFACAGFRLEKVLDWVGKIDANGEITGEATETTVSSSGAIPTEGADAAQPRPAATRAKLDLGARSGKKAADGKDGATARKNSNAQSSRSSAKGARGKAAARKGGRRSDGRRG